MKTSIYSILLAFFLASNLLAQKPRDHAERHEQLKTARIGMITNRLNLTTEQAPGFWAVYNEYDEEITATRRKIRQVMVEGKDTELSDKKIETNIATYFVLKDRENEIEKKYYQKLQKIISVRQYAELKRTEFVFNQMLLSKMNKGSRPQ
jgi:Spy/CpxP family protein refolding chaperone